MQRMGGEVKRYVMPSTIDERRQLIRELCDMATEVLGYPTRQANIALWSEMQIGELRRVHGNWEELMRRRAVAKPKEEQSRAIAQCRPVNRKRKEVENYGLAPTPDRYS